ncbi:EscS/YscS/HrcS family type III secretion system export apparatus protein [Pseudomonas lactis]|uniref:EscS/YscS/HrcS family type III secretion system export apparatus protein n=1 Tax=Pseudomonas lactis TaxID=1615674 RepID=UPI002E35FB80|nr:flagellar biosynthetic protein FliQ [Pseudomonas lactis]
MEPIVLFKQGMLLVVMLTAPPLIVAVVVGVMTSLVQALMQVQDQTLPFGIKLVARLFYTSPSPRDLALYIVFRLLL